MKDYVLVGSENLLYKKCGIDSLLIYEITPGGRTQKKEIATFELGSILLNHYEVKTYDPSEYKQNLIDSCGFSNMSE